MSKRIKSYNTAWNVDKVFYVDKLGSFSFRAVGFFAVGVFVMLVIGDYIWIPFFNGDLEKKIILPAVVAYLMCKQTFYDMRPYSFIGKCVIYLFRPHRTCMGQKRNLRKEKIKRDKITVVRTERRSACEH